MGLDMYLYLKKERYVSTWTESKLFPLEYPPELKPIVDIAGRELSVEQKTYYRIGYWRKANAIHAWFVRECAGGVDECQEIYVSKEKAKELLDLCKQVLDDHSLAEPLLPTQDGFFFGTTAYDEWYFKDIEHTVEILEATLKVLEQTDQLRENMKNSGFSWNDADGSYGYDIIYNASW